MGKKDELVVNLAPKKFIRIAEKILEGLLESGFVKENMANIDVVYFPERVLKNGFVEAIAEAIKKNLTYGNLGTLTLRNNLGEIVAKLYILPDGTLADDSWVRNEGWKH